METQQYSTIYPEQMEIIFQSETCTVSRYEDELGVLVKALPGFIIPCG